MKPIPSEENDYLYQHIAILRSSYRHYTGQDLISSRLSDKEAARYLYDAPFALLSHDNALDPVFSYANQTAQNLFGMSWDQITRLPSRFSAEPIEREQREKLLSEVSSKGYIKDYSGVRVGRHGRRFLIEKAVVWNLVSGGRPKGQAAMFRDWRFC